MVFVDTEIKSTGFTYLDDALPEEIKDFSFPEEIRRKMLLVTDEQVHEELHNLIMDEIETSIQLVFRDSLCLDCGALGDERLLDKFCHMEYIEIHPDQTQYFHPNDKVSIARRRFCKIKVIMLSIHIGILSPLGFRRIPLWPLKVRRRTK